MKLTNFKIEDPIQGERKSDKHASVDVITGFFFKKTVSRRICRANLHWFFMDDGEWTPGYQAENLYRAWEASHEE